MFTITSGEIAGSMLTRATPRLVATLIAAALVGRMFAVGTDGLDRAAAKWVDETLRRTSLDEKVGQLLASSMESTFTSTDSDVFDGLASLVRDQHVGGFHLFGGMDPVPGVLLNPTYGVCDSGPSAGRGVDHESVASDRGRSADE
jgi:hypothetical protein